MQDEKPVVLPVVLPAPLHLRISGPTTRKSSTGSSIPEHPSTQERRRQLNPKVEIDDGQRSCAAVLPSSFARRRWHKVVIIAGQLIRPSGFDLARAQVWLKLIVKSSQRTKTSLEI
ncbi:uncharacterized protein LOC111410010 [Olea europaea var. sylvestris]|uniref:uncharacterized protein LOC111410010 n=1 Tax=Olea europaea var. sylvestris TaxID=158386 RepID=UPI000C1D768A|nr:uncharacterized protein LOC111410010 [Olea europaea var. sylvestris]